MENLEKALFYKPTGTVQIANKFSLIERKLLNALVWHSQKNKFNHTEQSIPVRDIFILIGLEKSENYDIIKDALRVLTSNLIEWNIFEEDRVTEWGMCTFLASGAIKEGKLKYMLNPKWVEQIKQPTLYAKILLLVQSQIKKRHALVLYEFFLDTLSRVRSEALKTVVPLTHLYSLLGVNPDMSYKIFNRDVIKPSLKEINEHTDITVNYSTNRRGRSVHEIVFNLEKQKAFPISLDFAINTQHQLDQPQMLPTAVPENLCHILVLQGIAAKKAKQLVAQFSAERIQGNINYVLTKQQQGKPISNPAAYLVKAIEDDYRLTQNTVTHSSEKQYLGIPESEIAKQAKPGESWLEVATRIKATM